MAKQLAASGDGVAIVARKSRKPSRKKLKEKAATNYVSVLLPPPNSPLIYTATTCRLCCSVQLKALIHKTRKKPAQLTAAKLPSHCGGYAVGTQLCSAVFAGVSTTATRAESAKNSASYQAVASNSSFWRRLPRNSRKLIGNRYCRRHSRAEFAHR